MAENVLDTAAELLAGHYGKTPAVGPVGEWTTLVRVVLLSGRKLKKGADWSWLDESALRSAEEAAACRGESLEAELDSAGIPSTKVACLQALAKWWMKRIGEERSSVDQWVSSRDRWRDELRRLPGVNWELADRILLFVGGVATMPLDRGTMRIAARHGWVETIAEYEEWQSFFIRGLTDAGVDLAEFSQSMTRIGRDFCGKIPKCDECPLKSLLPMSGPLPIDGSESD